MEHPGFFERAGPFSLSDVAKAGGWDASLPPVVANAMKFEGSYVAAPVNVHRVNWMWVNPAVLQRAGVTPPKNWDEMIAAAEKILSAADGVVDDEWREWMRNRVKALAEAGFFLLDCR